MNNLIDELATYIGVLARSARETNRAEDRATYTNHLAAAAEIFTHLHSGHLLEANEIIRAQRRAFGWGYLSGPAGSAAEAAFDRFAKMVESSQAA